MPWSTRELAELAQTTVNTIRHYHHLGILDEPERDTHGHKRYNLRHLRRLLMVRRLVALGVPLAKIGDDGMDGQGIREELRRLDAELVASIQRLQSIRLDIAAWLDPVKEAGTATEPAHEQSRYCDGG